MANYETLKSAIQQVVKTNGNNEITGALLQQSLLAMINSLGFGYQFVGVATLATNPGTPDQKVFYIANGTGTYTNFDGISITEDEVVILYYDTAWHKLLTGIASQDKLAELEQDVATKQDALTLTIKDNGNIVIANIQGQSKEFMPATPSGDPMHYAYVAAGAEYNNTGADIVKTTPWANMVDDDADKTVVHKAGYWYLNGLGDITTEQMRTIFIETNNLFEPADKYAGICQLLKSRVNLYRGSPSNHFSRGVTDWNSMLSGSKMEVVYLLAAESYSPRPNHLGALARGNSVVFIIYCIFDCKNTSNFGGIADKAISLKYMWLKSVKKSVSLNSCSKFANCCILYMIQNEAATSAITITLHADAYARAMANADIVAALQAHPNVSLASA